MSKKEELKVEKEKLKAKQSEYSVFLATRDGIKEEINSKSL